MTTAAATVFCVALTGGIASGKSATTDRFAQLHVPIFDADVAARAIVAPGQPALAEIAAAFGADMIDGTGMLDRARMRERVFADAAARKRLEALLHPRIRALLIDGVRLCRAPYCVLAIPLFVEARADYRWVDRVLVTDVPPAVQIERLMRRPGVDAELARQMLAAQATRAQRLALAEDIIDNTAPLGALQGVIERLHARYLALAARRGA